MKRILEGGVFAAAMLWAAVAIAAQGAVPIDDPLQVDFPPTVRLTAAEVGERIKLVAGARSWRVEADAPGRMGLSTIVNSKHLMRVDIHYSASAYTIRYLDSMQLKYRAESRTIHPSYNLWIRDFSKAINTALGVTAEATVPLTIPGSAAVPVAAAAGASVGAAASAPAAPAAQGMPAPGSKWRYGYRDRQYNRDEQFFNVEVAGVDNTRVRERLMAPGGEASETVIDADKLAFVTRRLGPSQSVVELTPYLRDLQNRPNQPPAGYPGPDGTRWKVSAPEYVEEEVRVPAGNFKALRVEVRGSSEAFGGAMTGTSRFVYTAWYSRELNRYVRTQHQTWNRQNTRTSDEQVQLVSYQLGK